jgi:hypothetical protein
MVKAGCPFVKLATARVLTQEIHPKFALRFLHWPEAVVELHLRCCVGSPLSVLLYSFLSACPLVRKEAPGWDRGRNQGCQACICAWQTVDVEYKERTTMAWASSRMSTSYLVFVVNNQKPSYMHVYQTNSASACPRQGKRRCHVICNLRQQAELDIVNPPSGPSHSNCCNDYMITTRS